VTANDRYRVGIHEPTESAEGEVCRIGVAMFGEQVQPCGRDAKHKVSEVGYQERHPFTAYVCCFHFGAIMGQLAKRWCEHGFA